jgi:hypothetical protein
MAISDHDDLTLKSREELNVLRESIKKQLDELQAASEPGDRNNPDYLRLSDALDVARDQLIGIDLEIAARC